MKCTPMDPLPVRRRLTVLRDGSTSATSLVFCDSQMRSVPVSCCATCGAGGAVERDAEGWETTVECERFALTSLRPDPAPAAPGADGDAWGPGIVSVAARLPVGSCLVRPTVCLAHNAPLRVAARALEMETSAYGVPVVDEEGRLVGILPRATTALGLLKNAGDAAAEHVTIDWSTVDESLSLSGAFELMVTRRARELSVVGTGRTVVGTLRDIDALRFVAHVSRTGMRPPLERAA